MENEKLVSKIEVLKAASSVDGRSQSFESLSNFYDELEKKMSRISELKKLLNDEQKRSKELETKLKMIIELRERDTQLHLRQLTESEGQWRRAKTDTERLEIVQNELRLEKFVSLRFSSSRKVSF